MKNQIQDFHQEIEKLYLQKADLDGLSDESEGQARELRDEMSEVRQAIHGMQVAQALGEEGTGVNVDSLQGKLEQAAATERKFVREADVNRCAAGELEGRIALKEKQLTAFKRDHIPAQYGKLIPDLQETLRENIGRLALAYVRRDGLGLSQISLEKIVQMAVGHNRSDIGSPGQLSQAVSAAEDYYRGQFGA